jgi:hypothetical protein
MDRDDLTGGGTRATIEAAVDAGPDAAIANRDIRAVLHRLIEQDGDAGPAPRCADADRLHGFMLDHVHNQARLAQVLVELGASAARDAA